MKIKIVAFGIAKDIIGQSITSVELSEGATINEAKRILNDKYPEFGKLRSLRIAINEEYRDDNEVIASTDELVIIPPVSGG